MSSPNTRNNSESRLDCSRAETFEMFPATFWPRHPTNFLLFKRLPGPEVLEENAILDLDIFWKWWLAVDTNFGNKTLTLTLTATLAQNILLITLK